MNPFAIADHTTPEVSTVTSPTSTERLSGDAALTEDTLDRGTEHDLTGNSDVAAPPIKEDIPSSPDGDTVAEPGLGLYCLSDQSQTLMTLSELPQS